MHVLSHAHARKSRRNYGHNFRVERATVCERNASERREPSANQISPFFARIFRSLAREKPKIASESMRASDASEEVLGNQNQRLRMERSLFFESKYLFLINHARPERSTRNNDRTGNRSETPMRAKMRAARSHFARSHEKNKL